MATATASVPQLASQILKHLLKRIEATPAENEPFSHIFVEQVFPDDVYRELLRRLPAAELYHGAAERHHKGEAGYQRAMFHLTPTNLQRLSSAEQDFWRSIAAALTAPELKCAMFAKLSRDLAYRYGIRESEVRELAGYARPTLYRETEGFEIPPHPDTRKKVVTMHLYWPADCSQLDLGTALYRRKLLGWPLGNWRNRFEKVKQFPFRPNSGYAFVVNNTLTHKSWHGRECLPDGAGVRNTLLNTFYDTPREGFQYKAA